MYKRHCNILNDAGLFIDIEIYFKIVINWRNIDNFKAIKYFFQLS